MDFSSHPIIKTMFKLNQTLARGKDGAIVLCLFRLREEPASPRHNSTGREKGRQALQNQGLVKRKEHERWVSGALWSWPHAGSRVMFTLQFLTQSL